jgi:hypothetical protein
VREFSVQRAENGVAAHQIGVSKKVDLTEVVPQLFPERFPEFQFAGNCTIAESLTGG